MIGRKIQRLEVVVVGLDLWPLGDGISHGLEDADHLVGSLDDRVLRPQRPPNAGKCDVEPLSEVKISLKCLESSFRNGFRPSDNLCGRDRNHLQLLGYDLLYNSFDMLLDEINALADHPF